MQYLNFEDFKNMGGFADETAFDRLIVRAEAIIENATLGKINQLPEPTNKVKCCVRDLVDYLATNDEKAKVITSKSQSVGGVSESESYSYKSYDDYSQDIWRILYDYLCMERTPNNVLLLYRGFGA